MKSKGRNKSTNDNQDWRVWLEQDGNPISFWHDVPLYPDEKNNNIVNIYVEIPRWTDAKIETKRNKPLSEQYLSSCFLCMLLVSIRCAHM
jgi:inorganic pyrophosphatase